MAALIAAMTLLSGAGFTASVASADTDTVGYETDRIAFSGARTVCGECSIDFAATDGKARQRIRSKFLDTALTETYVDLIIEVGGACCDIRRTPEYERADAGVELKGADADYQCPGGIIGFDNCSNAGYSSAQIIRPADVKGKKKPDSSRPYLCFLAEHMNVPPTDDAVYHLQE